MNFLIYYKAFGGLEKLSRMVRGGPLKRNSLPGVEDRYLPISVGFDSPWGGVVPKRNPHGQGDKGILNDL